VDNIVNVMAALIVLVTCYANRRDGLGLVRFPERPRNIENRKLDANNLGMPGDYHTIGDQARGENSK
jgi:hypothetical protein